MLDLFSKLLGNGYSVSDIQDRRKSHSLDGHSLESDPTSTTAQCGGTKEPFILCIVKLITHSIQKILKEHKLAYRLGQIASKVALTHLCVLPAGQFLKRGISRTALDGPVTAARMKQMLIKKSMIILF